MNLKVRKVEFDQVKSDILSSMAIHQTLIDSYLEEHIMKSEYYVVELDGEQVGSFAIYKQELLSHFYVREKYLTRGQEVFDLARKSDHVTRAYVSTADELFLSHALDCSKRIENQAYFFRLSEEVYETVNINDQLELKLAQTSDAEMIKEKSGDFFEDIPRQINNKELFIGYTGETVVSFGIIERSQLYGAVGSTGMFVMPEHRLKGIGKSTIALLIKQLKDQNITPIAGCWYYNHNSKKTLQQAGYYTKTRLLNIHL